MRTPCIDMATYRIHQAVLDIKGQETEPGAVIKPLPEVTDTVVADSERAVSFLLAERRRANVSNRIRYEEKAWNIINKIMASLDGMSQHDLLDTFSGQKSSRSIQAIERLTRSLGVILKNLDLEAETFDGIEEQGVGLLNDDELDDLLNRAEGRDVEVIEDKPEYVDVEYDVNEPRIDETGEGGEISTSEQD